jgi:hypothetical protein
MRVNNMRTANPFLAAMLLAASSAFAQSPDVKIGGAGWMQLGKIEESTVLEADNDYNDNWMQSGGAILNLSSRFDERWDAAFGFGVVGVHLARGSRSQVNFWYPFWVPFVSEVRLTRSSAGFTEGSKFQLTMGNFGYGYNPDVKNLGQYLMRGYVYPGGLVSGFGNVFGTLARYEAGAVRNDLILKSENEDRPIYDFSVADVVNWRVTDGFEVGAGVNFYRLFRSNDAFANKDNDCPIADGDQCFIVTLDTVVTDSAGTPVTTIVRDTTSGSLSGTKLMARFRLDPKKLFGLTGIGGRSFGGSDLVIYGEAAVLGLTDYPKHYEDIKQRMPVMVGFNFPTLGYLDFLSVEVEYYASKNFSDVNYTGQSGSWIPRTDGPAMAADTKRDDWKWSVNTAKVVFGNLQVSGQVANDHLRPGGMNHSPNGFEALSTPKDWYWTAKLAYFF